MTTWNEARSQLRSVIAKTEEVINVMQRQGAKMPPIDGRHLKDPNPVVRKLVASALAVIAVRDCSSAIMHDMLVGLNDTENEVRESVGRAFGVCGYVPAIDSLIRLLENSNTEQRRKIGLDLCAIGECAVPKLLACLASEQSVASKEAANILYNMGPDVVDWLMKELEHNTLENWLLSLSVLSHFPVQTQSKFNAVLTQAYNVPNPDLAEKIIQAWSLFNRLSERTDNS
jgi:hypothetical protein